MEFQNEKDGENLGGKIVINSPIPKNRFSKYIVLTLKNKEGKEATVKYKQSPLIETQNFFGDYSSRSESGWAYRTAAGKIVKITDTPMIMVRDIWQNITILVLAISIALNMVQIIICL